MNACRNDAEGQLGASCVFDEVSWEVCRGPEGMNACRNDAQGQLGGLMGASGKLCKVVSGGFGQMRCSIEGCYLRDAEKREGRRRRINRNKRRRRRAGTR